MFNNYKYGAIYQFTVLGVLAAFGAAHLYLTKELNETIIGAIIGVMISMPFNDNGESKK